jgi:hypothetical protein
MLLLPFVGSYLMDAVLIGYFPKKLKTDTTDLNAPHLTEVCSVSSCIAEAPEGWLQLWKHNDVFMYNSVEEAFSILKELKEDEDEYNIYAYKLYPIKIDKGNITSEKVVSEKVEPLSKEFNLLGYDAVNKTQDYGEFECSPLSCNYGLEIMKTNKYCLFETFENAFEGAKKFSEGLGEPGPYYILEVYRKRKSKASCTINPPP